MEYLADRYYIVGVYLIPGEALGNENLGATMQGMLWCGQVRKEIEKARKECGWNELQINA